MTILEILTAATGHLERRGVESPRLNAEHLLAHVLSLRRLDLYLSFDRPVSDQERSAFRELIRERSEGRPLQHLLGTVEFCGRSFLCDARALVPRPETEQLAELANAALGSGSEPPSILDVGTGSGVIAVTLALEAPSAAVSATDISSEALSLARENAARHGATVACFEADLLPKDGTFDLIVANLPYIPTGQLDELSREVRQDPPSALDGGPDGLEVIRRLVAMARSRLRGAIFLEVGHDQAAAACECFRENQYRDIRTHRDLQGAERFASATV